MTDSSGNRPGHGRPGAPEVGSAGEQPALPQTLDMGDQQVDNDLPTTASSRAPSLNVQTNQEKGQDGSSAPNPSLSSTSPDYRSATEQQVNREQGQDTSSALLLAQAPITIPVRSAGEYQNEQRQPPSSIARPYNQLEEGGPALLSTKPRDEQRPAVQMPIEERHIWLPPPPQTTEQQGYRPIPPSGFEEEIKRYTEKRAAERTAAGLYHFSRILPTPTPGQNPLHSGREITLGLITVEIGNEPMPRHILQLLPRLALKLNKGWLEYPLLNGRKLGFDSVLTKPEAVEFGRFICQTRPEMFAPGAVEFDICSGCGKLKVQRAPLSLIDTSSRPDVGKPARWSPPLLGKKKKRTSEASSEIWDSPESPPEATPESLPDTPPGPPRLPPVLEGPKSWAECKSTWYGTRGFSEFAQFPCRGEIICIDCYHSTRWVHAVTCRRVPRVHPWPLRKTADSL